MADIRIWRGAVKSKVSSPASQIDPLNDWSGTTDGETGIVAGLPISGTAEDLRHGITIKFSITAGSGRSAVCAWVGPSSFAELASAMVGASPEEAEAAFIQAMHNRRQKNAKPSKK